MFTLHLSRYLSGPPGPEIQKLNALLHQEPYATIAYAFYWSLVLTVGAPLVGIGLLWMSVYELICQFCWNRRRIEPKKELQQSNKELAVVITGCDSGFGKELVFRLAAEGFVVFAGCLKEESKKQFACEPLIHPLVLDVTSDEHVQEAFQMIQKWLNHHDTTEKKQHQRYLHALVNNAGIGKSGFIDWSELSDYRICMEGESFISL
jgi:hypothetical protein